MGDKTKDVKNEVFKTIIKKVGIIDLDTLYSSIKKLATPYGYLVTEEEQSKKIEVGEFTLIWNLEKKFDLYTKANINIELETAKCVDVLVERKGKKEKRYKCETLIQINSFLIKNYKNDFNKTSFQNFLRRLYEKFMKEKELKYYEKSLEEESINITNGIKTILEHFN